MYIALRESKKIGLRLQEVSQPSGNVTDVCRKIFRF